MYERGCTSRVKEIAAVEGRTERWVQQDFMVLERDRNSDGTEVARCDTSIGVRMRHTERMGGADKSSAIERDVYMCGCWRVVRVAKDCIR